MERKDPRHILQYLHTYFGKRNGIEGNPVEGTNFTLETLTYMTPANRADQITNIITDRMEKIGKTPYGIFECCAGTGGNTLSFLSDPNVQWVVSYEILPERREMLIKNIAMYDLAKGNRSFVPAEPFTGVPDRFKDSVLYLDPPWLPSHIRGHESTKDQYVLHGIKIGDKTLEEWIAACSACAMIVMRVPPGYKLDPVPGFQFDSQLLGRKKNSLLIIVTPDRYVVKPALKPTLKPTLKPALQPAKPPSQPALQPAKSPSKPALKPALQPAKHPSKPALKPAKSPSKPALKPALQPAKSPSKPALQPAKSPSKPTLQPAKPPSKPTLQPAKPPSKPALQPAKSPSNPDGKDQAWREGLKAYLRDDLLKRILPQENYRSKMVEDDAMDIWINVFTHESYDPNVGQNYEELEFLGDEVMNHNFAKYIMQKFPKINRHQLSEMKHQYLSKPFQAQISLNYGMDKWLRTGIDKNTHIFEDILEAMFGGLELVGDKVFKFGAGNGLAYSMILHIFQGVDLDFTKIRKISKGQPKTQIKQNLEKLHWGKAIETYDKNTRIGTVALPNEAIVALRKLGVNITTPVLASEKGTTKKTALIKAYDVALQKLIKMGITDDWIVKYRASTGISTSELGDFGPAVRARLAREGFADYTFNDYYNKYVVLVGIRADGSKMSLVSAGPFDKVNIGRQQVLQEYAAGK